MNADLITFVMQNNAGYQLGGPGPALDKNTIRPRNDHLSQK